MATICGVVRTLEMILKGRGLASVSTSIWTAIARSYFATPVSSALQAEGLSVSFRPFARLAQNEVRRCTGCATAHFAMPASGLKRIPGRGGGEFQISNIGAET